MNVSLLQPDTRSRRMIARGLAALLALLVFGAGLDGAAAAGRQIDDFLVDAPDLSDHRKQGVELVRHDSEIRSRDTLRAGPRPDGTTTPPASLADPAGTPFAGLLRIIRPSREDIPGARAAGIAAHPRAPPLSHSTA